MTRAAELKSSLHALRRREVIDVDHFQMQFMRELRIQGGLADAS